MALTKAELKAWTDALRANPEQQLTGMLVNKDRTKFCCLGKFCDLQGLTFTVKPLMTNHAWGYKTEAGHFEDTVLPEELAFKLTGETSNTSASFFRMGMPNMSFSVDGKLKVCDNAAQANDSGATWPEIADHFDKYYKTED